MYFYCATKSVTLSRCIMSRTNGFASCESTGQMCPSYYVAARRTSEVTRPPSIICRKRAGHQSVQTRPWPFAVRSEPSIMSKRQLSTRKIIIPRLSNCALWRPSSIKTTLTVKIIHHIVILCGARVWIRPCLFLSLYSLCWRTIIFWRNSWGIVTDSMPVP